MLHTIYVFIIYNMKTLTNKEEVVLNHIQNNLNNGGYFALNNLNHAEISTDATWTDTSLLTQQEIFSVIASLVTKKIVNYTWVNDELIHILSSQIPQS